MAPITVNLVPNLYDGAGKALSQGWAVLTPQATLQDASDAMLITMAPVQAALGTATAIIASDSPGPLPAGWVWEIAFRNVPGNPAGFAFLAPAGPCSFTATNANPCVFTWTPTAPFNAAGLESMPNGTVITLAGGSLPAGFTAATSYYVVNSTGETFELAATLNGSAIASTGTGAGAFTVAQWELSALSPLASVSGYTTAMPVPAGSALAGSVPIATGAGEASAWGVPSGLGLVDSVAAGDASVVVGGTSANPTLETGTLDVLAALHPPAGNWSNNSKRITGLANGAAGTDAAAFGQIPTLASLGGAPLASPTFTGAPAGPTPGGGDNSTKLATTAFVGTALAGLAPGMTQASVQTSTYTATANQAVPCDISGGSFTVTLPGAPAAGTLFSASVVAVSGVGVNTLTLAAGGSDVFDKTGGATTATLTLLHQSLLYVYNSGVWAKLAAADPWLQVASAREGAFYLDQYAGTDDQKMALALAAAVNTAGFGGATIRLSPRAHAFANQWATAYSSSGDFCIRISGSGGIPHGNSESAPIGVTTCAMSYSGPGVARMDFEHAGSIEIDHILFTDSGGSAVPFFQTTNANVYIHDCSFKGSAVNQACFQDAINMGGLGTTLGAGSNAPFQGYQSVVERVNFSGIRSCVAARTYANSVSVRDCLVDASCGSANPVSVTDGAMTTGSAVLTCATSTPFTSGMVGLPVIVSGAGTAELGQYYVGVITTFTDSAHVTLSGSGAAQTVSAATVTVTNAAAFSIGTSAATGGVEGCVIDDCCVEVSNYAIGILINQSTGNAVTGTALWDGIASKSLIGVACVNASSHNYIHLTECGIWGSGSIYTSDFNGTTAGQDVVIALAGSTPVVYLPSVTLNGSQPLKLFGTSSSTPGLAAGLAFGPAGGGADSQIFRDSSGNLNLAPKSGSGIFAQGGTTANNLLIGAATNYANLGPQGTSAVYLSASGSNANVPLNLVSKGTSLVNVASKLASTFAGTPAVAPNANAGSGATVSVVGNDQRGTITLTTGSAPSAGDQLTLTFTATGGTFSTAPVVVVCGQGSAASAALAPYPASAAGSNFHLGVAVAPAATTAYTFSYFCIG